MHTSETNAKPFQDARTKRARKLTLTRLAVHDFNRALRVWRKQVPPINIFKQLARERGRVLGLALRSLGLALVGTLWLIANKSELSLKVALVDITIPAAYVNFVVALLIFVSFLHYIDYSFLNEFVRIASDKLFKFDSAWVLTVFQDGAGAWSIPWVQQFRFLSSSAAHRGLALGVIGLVNLPLLLFLSVGYWTVFSVGLSVLLRDGISVTGAFTIAGWLLMVFPIALIMLLRVPFKFTKNTAFVRWNFLYRMHRRTGGRPPRVGYWISRTVQRT